ncbi:MAG: hypothetical protein NTZ43_03735 [Gemmatimonadetes bacterium]|nr:hypothetical protein [Gemmatimonadota bacterium]
MANFWTDHQEAAYRTTERPGGRWSGGVYVPASEPAPKESRRPGFMAQVVRAIRDLRKN